MSRVPSSPAIVEGPLPQTDTRFRLDDDVVVITGAAGYLGPMHAQAVLSVGGAVVLLDVRAPELHQLVADLRRQWPSERVSAFCGDLSDPATVRAAHNAALDRFGKVTALINNAGHNPAVGSAGLTPSGRLEAISCEQWHRELDSGLTTAFLCSQAFGTTMANCRLGSIINIASDLAIIGPDQRLYRHDGLPDAEQPMKPVTYSVVKSGLAGLTRYLATYWADRNVRANTLSLGGVFAHQPRNFLEQVTSRIPLGRLASREEYQGCIIFLCSRASSYMTGANLVVDGGRTIW